MQNVPLKQQRSKLHDRGVQQCGETERGEQHGSYGFTEQRLHVWFPGVVWRVDLGCYLTAVDVRHARTFKLMRSSRVTSPPVIVTMRSAYTYENFVSPFMKRQIVAGEIPVAR